MSDSSAFGFGKFMPGFDFLQNLAQSASAPQTAGSAIPGMSSWVAPTLSVEELDKRIQELKAVQFWLEQNGTALKATIQALEVQKMTLTTLQGMNVNMAELAKAFTARAPEPSAAAPTASAPEPVPAPQPEPEPQAAPDTANPSQVQSKRSGKARAKAKDVAATASVDPMRWWGSLTQQFQNIASAAMKDVAAEAMKAQTKAKAAEATAPTSAKTPARKASGKTAARQSAAKKAPRTASPKRAR